MSRPTEYPGANADAHEYCLLSQQKAAPSHRRRPSHARFITAATPATPRTARAGRRTRLEEGPHHPPAQSPLHSPGGLAEQLGGGAPGE